MKKRIITVSLVLLLFFMAPAHGFAAQSPFLRQLQDLFVSLIVSKSAGNAVPASSSPSSASSSDAPTIGLPFGGPIIFGPIKCDIPKGATYVIVGPPVSKPLLCQKGICKTYDFQPPYKIGQYLLGVALPSAPIPCIVGLSPVGAGFPIGNTPGVGASGSVSSGESVLSTPQNSSCVQSSYTSNNTFTKGVAENAVRDQLGKAGIGVNNTACDFGQNFQTHRRIFGGKGCTDLSGLQCQSTDYLQDLRQVCGAGSLVVTGGSELGHLTHDTGNAVDLSVKGTSLQSCLDTNDRFTNLGGGKYKDNKTNSIFTFETGEEHYHVCIPGSGC